MTPRARQLLTVTTVILLACLIAGCQTGKTAVPARPDIRGKIISVSGSANAGSIFIDGTALEISTIDKASVRIDAKTEILRQQDNKLVRARFSDLRVGQMAEATFTGPVLQSYPVQGTGRQVVILAAAGGK